MVYLDTALKYLIGQPEPGLTLCRSLQSTTPVISDSTACEIAEKHPAPGNN